MASSADYAGYIHTIGKLKTNKRTGWVRAGVSLPESIADHMYRMAMMALALPDVPGCPPLDIPKCVMMALVHDVAEADVGDITPFDGISKEEKHKMEVSAMDRICSLLGTSQDGKAPSVPAERIRALWEEYEARETNESRFVKDLDFCELAFQALEYEDEQSMQGLQEFFQSTVPRLQHPAVKAWAHQLMAERREVWRKQGRGEYKHVDVDGANELDSASSQ